MKKTIFTITTLAFLGLSTLHAQVKVGDNPTSIDASAELEVESSNKGFLPPRMTTAERNAISNPAEGLTIYNTDLRCLDTYNGVRWIACNSIAPTDVYNPKTGQIWMDRNLGASQVATSSTDLQSYGDLYQWGRAGDGHESRTSGTTSTLATSDNPGHGNFITVGSSPFDWRNPQNDNLWQGVNGTNNPCPTGYRLPTEAEWEAERNSWSSNNADGAFASPLKLPVAGSCLSASGLLFGDGADGYYWSSTVSGSDAKWLNFNSADAYISTIVRAVGYSVRCIKH